MHKMSVYAAVWLFGISAHLPLAADQTRAPLYDQISLHATAQGDVENDLMRVRMQVSHEHRDAAELANKVNTDMQWALAQLAEFSTIRFSTENYTTYPKYEQQRVAGWRSTQTLAMSSDDFEAIKKAVQILQSRLQVQQMMFEPRAETRRTTEDELINQALDNLKHRALLVQQNMGASGYRIIHLNIDTGHVSPGHLRMEATMMRSTSVDVAPAVEGGDSKISVTVSGQIQLQ